MHKGRIDEEALGVAIEMADEALRGSWLPRRGYAALVALLYEGVEQRMPYAQLLDFARLTAVDMARQREVADAAAGGLGPDRQAGLAPVAHCARRHSETR